MSDVSLSPDGSKIAFAGPTPGLGSAAVTLDLRDGKARGALVASSKPDRMGGCGWVSSDRLVRRIYDIVKDPIGLLPMNRLLAVDSSGSNLKILSDLSNANTQGYLLHGGDVMDWLPEEDGAVLMSRPYAPDRQAGSLLGSTSSGLVVD